MKKGVWFLLLLMLVLSCEKEDPKAEVVNVNGGIQFGFCIGYCKKEIRMSALKLDFVQGPTRDQTIPEKLCTINISPSEWHEIQSMVDDSFFDLEEVYGCPDCSDQGEEWIEVIITDRTYKVTFDPNLKIRIHPLVEAMRTWRKKAEEEEKCS